MPAPLAKGPGHYPCSSSPSSPNSRRPPPNHPLQTGIIIAASIVVAAGIAIYESPQVRQWVEQSRRKIAVALHSLGDDIQPRRQSETEGDFEERKKEAARQRRNELVRKAREEGVAVDLDELARIGREEVELEERQRRGGERRKRNASQRSFDDLVGSNGMLKDAHAVTTTGTETKDSGLRNRGAGAASFAAGAALAAAGNPFSDDHILFDRDEDEAPSPQPFTYAEPEPVSVSRESSATIEGDEHHSSATAGQLIDLSPDSVYLHPENIQTASIPSASAPGSVISTTPDADADDQAAQSFYSFASSSHPFEDAENISTGTLTPRSEASAFTGASVIGSQAEDIAVLSLQNDTDHEDTRSEIFSEGGFTEAGFSEAGFSELGEENRGIMTPSSWTDVGSDDESEWGGPAQGGQISQVHQ
ncbi:hypothetical protein CC80DRAFT_497405 [Byssothecium circinans]|uniref:Uncharacterized protein n=1 Tax=Byssothecium circinans TaxID=147558 RepID=A0A6A5TCQ5_9PLEO|nr:hypothetical protein CC80DRAFT_497405 [Byssothecium circinans]